MKKNQIMIKGAYGTMYEDVEIVNSKVTNRFGEEYEVVALNLEVVSISSQEKPEVGNIIMTSSSEFNVDALECSYRNLKRDYFESKVIARFEEFEGTNYVPSKSINGGGYLHKYWKIEEIISSEYVE